MPTWLPCTPQNKKGNTSLMHQTELTWNLHLPTSPTIAFWNNTNLSSPVQLFSWSMRILYRQLSGQDSSHKWQLIITFKLYDNAVNDFSRLLSFDTTKNSKLHVKRIALSFKKQEDSPAARTQRSSISSEMERLTCCPKSSSFYRGRACSAR